jgi:peptidoglycan hydrolase CwlO-like protein
MGHWPRFHIASTVKIGPLPTAPSTLGNIQSTLGNIQSTLGNIQSTLGNIQSTLGNIQSTLGSIQSAFREHSGRVERTPVSLHPNCQKHFKKNESTKVDAEYNLQT